MIDEERTFNEFGYISDILTLGSHKRIYAICSECGLVRSIQYREYNKSTTSKCAKCFRNSEREIDRGPFNIEYFRYIQESIDNTYIDEIATFIQFGYYSIDLTFKSHKKIVAICSDCGKLRLQEYRQHKMLCLSCRESGKRNYNFGKKLSIESRVKLSASKQRIAYEDWTGFSKRNLYPEDFNETLKMYIRSKYNNKCYICGKSELENNRKLSVHHIDRNKENTRENNLIPLCDVCHPSSHNKQTIARLQYLQREANYE